ncbi:MAG: MobC family replication-relaxation protein [Gallionellaceae bacterium]
MNPSKEKVLTIPHMSFLEKQSRADAKRELVLQFLASGEVFSTVTMLSRVISASPSSTLRTLDYLMRDGALKVEEHVIQCRHTHLYGITPHGLGLVGKFDSRHFELGKTNSAYIPHHLSTQSARLNAEESGWGDWVPGKILHGKGIEKVPDALVTSPSGKRVAIEIERHIKTPKRYTEIISAHLQAITQKHWAEVHYLCPDCLHKKVEAAFMHIDSVLVKGERVTLLQKHRDCFKFFALDAWPATKKGE